MSNQRTHYVTTTDGVTIGATVHGQGPTLVFLQGVIGDGDLDWQAVREHLTGRFTCHLPSMRGRGLSDDHSDLGFGRLVDDILTYVDSIGEPVGLVGWSLGAEIALAVAALSDAVNGVASLEPGMPALWNERERAAIGDAVARMSALASEGKSADAARALASFPFSDEDIVLAEDAGYFEVAGRYVPKMLNFFKKQMEYEGFTGDDPGLLGKVSAPVLVLLGSDPKPYAVRAARHVTDHVPSARVREVPGAGHASPLTHAEALAAALTEFFSPAQPPA